MARRPVRQAHRGPQLHRHLGAGQARALKGGVQGPGHARVRWPRASVSEPGYPEARAPGQASQALSVRSERVWDVFNALASSRDLRAR